MARVIVERERRSGTQQIQSDWAKIGGWRLLRAEGREEESPGREKIALKWARPKHQTDVLSPLVGFLRKNVGRPWNKVFSEITARLDRGNVLQRHVLVHLERDIVRQHMFERADGAIVDVTGRKARGWRGELFWVCPRTGLLRSRRLPARRRGGGDTRTIDAGTPHHEIDGLWYEITFAEIPAASRPERHRLSVWDVLRRSWAPPRPRLSRDAHWIDGGSLYAKTKRALSSREIARLELRTR